MITVASVPSTTSSIFQPPSSARSIEAPSSAKKTPLDVGNILVLKKKKKDLNEFWGGVAPKSSVGSRLQRSNSNTGSESEDTWSGSGESPCADSSSDSGSTPSGQVSDSPPPRFIEPTFLPTGAPDMMAPSSQVPSAADAIFVVGDLLNELGNISRSLWAKAQAPTA